ncbi:MAG: peptidylprolyl isomerase [Chitinophagaceae bacterium]
MKKLLTLVCCALGIANLSFGQQKKIVADKIVGIVGDKIILQSDIKNAIADVARQGQQIPEGAECSIMDQALTSKLLMLQALKDSLPVTDEEVEAELDQRVRYFINQYGDQATLEQVAGKTIYQIKDDARESVRENKLAQAMQRKIVDNVRITPTEVQAYFNRIPKDSLPFFETQLSIGQIVVYPKANRDLEKYVMDELNNYRNQVLNRQTTFDQLAKRYSEDPGSKDRGGQYQINRNEKQWDPAFMSAAFRLKEGEISQPIKTQFGYHIIQMVQRNGDDAIIRHILRIPPITATEIAESTSKLDSVRAKLIAGTIDFNTAAGKYTEDKNAQFAGPYILSRSGSTFVTIDELDKDVVAMLNSLKVGEYSQPTVFTDERGKKGVRILYLKSRSNPHRMNLRDDYDRIAQAALEEKKYQTLEKWMRTHMGTHYVMVDPSFNSCPLMNKWIEAQKTTASK